MYICTECGKPCQEVEKKDSVSYSHRDQNFTDHFSIYVSDCCGEQVKRVNEDECEETNE
ncbi:MAG: hypothetical protein ABFD76_10505 [Smithella sp.]